MNHPEELVELVSQSKNRQSRAHKADMQRRAAAATLLGRHVVKVYEARNREAIEVLQSDSTVRDVISCMASLRGPFWQRPKAFSLRWRLFARSRNERRLEHREGPTSHPKQGADNAGK